MILTWLINKRSQEGTGNILFTEIPNSNCSRCVVCMAWIWFLFLKMVWLTSGIHQLPIQSNSWPPTTSHHSDLIITTNISNKQEACYCPIPPLDVSQHNVDIVYTLPTVQLYTLSRDSTALQAENTTQLHDNKWSHTGFEHEWSLKWGGAISLKYLRKPTHLTNASIFNVLTSW